MKGWGLVAIAVIVLAAGCGNSSAPATAPTRAPTTEIALPTKMLAPTQTLTPTMTSTWTPIPQRAATLAPAPTLRLLPTAPPAGGGGGCCKHCGANSKPCGDTCISTKFTCNTPPGCACP